MKYFEELKVQLRQLGILHWDSSPKSRNIAIASRCGLIAIYVSNILAPAWYLLFEAKSPRENAECTIFALGSLFLFSWYLAILFQSEKYEKLFDELNAIIDASMLM